MQQAYDQVMKERSGEYSGGYGGGQEWFGSRGCLRHCSNLNSFSPAPSPAPPRPSVLSSAADQLVLRLGKFVYLLDAYDDLEKDRKRGSFNPLLSVAGRPDFDEFCHQMLVSSLDSAASSRSIARHCLGYLSRISS
mgnify:CR=1 FL=1